jgi:hypothetical protein
MRILVLLLLTSTLYAKVLGDPIVKGVVHKKFDEKLVQVKTELYVMEIPREFVKTKKLLVGKEIEAEVPYYILQLIKKKPIK